MTRARDLADSADKDIAGTLTLDGLTVDGKTTTDELDLNALAATISDTAVDVFVYDTSKDSDGGAWRKRTQGTSWYNETLNTATRGSRKEFPAVAVIVAESTRVTIYDGDDPDMPMWMVFNQGTNYAIGGASSTLSCAAMLNGILFVGRASNGFKSIHFVDDTHFFGNSSSGYFTYPNTISRRNNDDGFIQLSGSGYLVGDPVNDIAMTVLPNAPIDSATGLPVPTIAVATDGGVSVIKDDGTVVDITPSSAGFGSVDFFDERLAYSYGEGGIVNQRVGILDSIPSADTSSNDAQYVGLLEPTVDPTNPKLLSSAVTSGGATAQYVTHDADGFSVGAPYYIANSIQRLGVTRVLHNSTNISNSSVAYITSDYNTGWMNGDIKLATLSDTDDTDVTGAELVTGDNSTFANGIGDWYDNTYGSTLTNSGGYLTMNNTSSYQQAVVTISNALVVGETYVWSWDQMSQTSGNFRAFINSDTLTVPQNATGSFSMTFVATSTDLFLKYKRTATSGTCQVDNISVRLAEEDRSVNGNGLQVFGSITKDPVNTGADLVSYGSWSGSNYLHQPYNSDLAVGTGDISVSFWCNANSLSGSTRWIIDQGATGFEFAFSTGATFYNLTGSQVQHSAMTTGVWNYLATIRRSGVLYAYMNGKLVGSAAATGSITAANGTYVGIRSTLDAARVPDARMSLLRISATAPSPEQIKKIYEDEKHLFTENAKATLYGTSDAVTALAHDDSTELLHVGTSAGRSVFQGLRRVDNTTDAVGAAISASNGLVAED